MFGGWPVWTIYVDNHFQWQMNVPMNEIEKSVLPTTKFVSLSGHDENAFNEDRQRPMAVRVVGLSMQATLPS